MIYSSPQDLNSQPTCAAFVASLLTGVAAEGNCLIESELTVFDAECIPPVPLFEYLIRIQSLTGYSDEYLVNALSLIDRLIERGVVKAVTFYNVH